jgi:putative transposase
VAGQLMPDHLRMCLSIPPKYAVSNVVGYIKGKNTIVIAQRFGGRTRNFTGEVFWARRYFVSTLGLDEEMARANIRNQEYAVPREFDHLISPCSPALSNG